MFWYSDFGLCHRLNSHYHSRSFVKTHNHPMRHFITMTSSFFCFFCRFVVPINRWIQVAMIWSRAGRVVFMKLFINGEMKLNRTAAHNLNINFKNSGHAVYDIGLKRDSGTTTHAYLRELMVFGRELQINKIKHLWFGRQFMPLSN